MRKLLELNWAMTKVNLKLRYEGSYLGVVWYLLKPLLILGILVLVFSNNIGRDTIHYPLYVLLGLIMWDFFSEGTHTGMQSTKNRLIRTINFPREALVISSVLTSLVSHLFEIAVFALFLLVFGISPLYLVFYIGLLFFFFFFTLGATFFLSSINMYFNDLENVWDFLLRAGWFATPIFYSISAYGNLFTFNLFNPLYYFITAARDMVIYLQAPPNWMLGGIAAFSASSLVIGYLTFNRLKSKFAELM